MFLQIETDSISPGAYIFQRPFLRGLLFGGAYIWRGLCKEGNLRFKTDWANLIVGSKLTVFALFYFVFEGNFPSTSFPRARVGLIFGGAYFRNFTVSTFRRHEKKVHSMYSFEVKYRTVELILSCRFKKKVYFVNTQ